MTSYDDNQTPPQTWQLVAQDEKPDQNATYLIIPMTLWLAEKAAYENRTDVALWLDSDEEPEHFAGEFQHFAFVALNFPSFKDGRPYSTASILRQRLGYTGELRAIGDVRADQLEQMKRCGFDTFNLADGSTRTASDIPEFSYHYQSAADGSEPLFRTRTPDHNS